MTRLIALPSTRGAGRPPLPFAVSVSDRDGWCGLALQGELDFATAPLLEHELVRTHRDGCDCLLVDLCALTFMDMAGVRVLLAAQERVQAGGGALLVLHAPQVVRRLVKVAGLDRLLTLLDDDAALPRRRSRPRRLSRLRDVSVSGEGR